MASLFSLETKLGSKAVSILDNIVIKENDVCDLIQSILDLLDLNLKHGDLIALKGREARYIYNNHSVLKLSKTVKNEDIIPPQFTAIEKFPILYWKGLLQNNCVPIKQGDYSSTILEELQRYPINIKTNNNLTVFFAYANIEFERHTGKRENYRFIYGFVTNRHLSMKEIKQILKKEFKEYPIDYYETINPSEFPEEEFRIGRDLYCQIEDAY